MTGLEPIPMRAVERAKPLRETCLRLMSALIDACPREDPDQLLGRATWTIGQMLIPAVCAMRCPGDGRSPPDRDFRPASPPERGGYLFGIPVEWASSWELSLETEASPAP